MNKIMITSYSVALLCVMAIIFTIANFSSIQGKISKGLELKTHHSSSIIH